MVLTKWKEEPYMNGAIIVGIGIGMLVLAVILLIASVIYRKSSGKKIREEILNEYEKNTK